MSDSSPPTLGTRAGTLASTEPLLDRRGFLTTAGGASIAALLASACGGGGDGAPTGVGSPSTPGALPTGIARDGSTLRVEVDRVATLRSTNGFVIVATPATVIINLGNDDYRAFTARCPHAGCLVGSVTTAGIVCPCHGSTFDVRNGRVLVGPAEQGLRALPATLATDTRVLTVNAA